MSRPSSNDLKSGEGRRPRRVAFSTWTTTPHDVDRTVATLAMLRAALAG